jgi:hypothetical protein
MESFGIYHPRIMPESLIKVARKEGIKFKIADICRAAFKVRATSSNDKAFLICREIIDFWLKFDYDRYGYKNNSQSDDSDYEQSNSSDSS